MGILSKRSISQMVVNADNLMIDFSFFMLEAKGSGYLEAFLCFLTIRAQISFLQVLFLIRQMEHSNTQSVIFAPLCFLSVDFAYIDPIEFEAKGAGCLINLSDIGVRFTVLI